MINPMHLFGRVSCALPIVDWVAICVQFYCKAAFSTCMSAKKVFCIDSFGPKNGAVGSSGLEVQKS